MENELQAYLVHSVYIDWQHPALREKAHSLANGLTELADVAKACFEYVRDEIAHSADFKRDGTTCIASDVLVQGHGYCYAKSHLLAALLRANGIPAALCYQRLTISDFPEEGEALDYCLHGLNAVYLPDIMKDSGFGEHVGWYRVDPRGNKAGVNAQFTPPTEQLAFTIKSKGEADLDGLYAEPLSEVVQVLEGYDTWQEVMDHLPHAVAR